MPKNRESKEPEYFKAIIRSQKKEIRQLQRQIKQLQKLLNYDQNKMNDIKEDSIPEEMSITCTVCGKGEVQIIDLLGRIYHSCKLCETRIKIK